MRVLHLDSGREMRGGQWQVLRLLEGLSGAGVDCTLLARGHSPLLEAGRKRGWRTEALTPVKLLFEARRHDLVHAHDARSHTLAAVSATVPLIVARRVAFPIGSAWKYGRARRIVAISEYVKSIVAAGGVAEETIRVVPDGVPLLDAAQGTAVLALANGSDPNKGEALAREAASRAGVPLKLTTELERDLSGAAVFVYLTYSEGLGSAALLAMSAGVAVVASRVGGLPEAIRNGENGLLVENTAESVAEALREFARNPDLARRLGQAGRHTIEQQFTVDAMVRRTLAVYHEVLS